MRILRGHLVLMESNAHYLGALDSYVLAPYIAIFGSTVAAVRIGFATVGAGYAVMMAVLGRAVFRRDRAALLLGGLAAIFPLFAVTYGVKARTYGLLLPLEALCLLLAIRLGWTPGPRRTRDWVIFGLVVGLSAWHDILLGITIGVCALGLLARGPVIGWPALRRGGLIATGFAVLGFSPWIVYNLQTHLGSLRHLYTPLSLYHIPTLVAAQQVASTALPIFVGARVDFCGPATVPAAVVDAILLFFAVAVLWSRRATLASLRRGVGTAVEPVDLVLAVAPLAVLAVTIRWFNALSCEPRYLMPFAVPLVTSVVLLLLAPRITRGVAAVALAALLVISGITLQRQFSLQRDLVEVPGAPAIRLDWRAATEAIQKEHPEALWGQYWLARPIQYVSGDRLVVGDYGGYVGFPDTQLAAFAAAHPSWLFVVGASEINVFQSACVQRGISYRTVTPAPGLVLFADLSQRLTPSDLGLPTQSVSQAS